MGINTAYDEELQEHSTYYGKHMLSQVIYTYSFNWRLIRIQIHGFFPHFQADECICLSYSRLHLNLNPTTNRTSLAQKSLLWY